ncbi:MAG: hypothetical protein SFU86_14525, partial [Pirellulaceae bacterium]|nr:hypothetical protein [Pirellulaceae bacterium]
MRSVNGLVILLSLTTAVFAYTVAIRAPWFGQLTDCSHEWCTATSLIWAQNWYREGALQSGFLLLENPASPEFTTLDSRSPYVSYPPGSILPLHVLSLLRGREPDLPLIMGVSLAGHWLVAASLAAAVYWLLLKCGLPMWNALLGAVPAPLIELLSPSPLYCHQNFYAMDSLAVVLFAICLALETARWTFPRWSTLADALLWVMLLLGYLTDWLFALVGPTLLVCRLVLEWRDRTNWRQRMLGTIVYWSSAMLAAGLFIGQLTILGRWHSLYDRFLERTGLTTARNSYGFAEFLYKFFWEEYVPGGYGAGTAWLLLAAISA